MGKDQSHRTSLKLAAVIRKKSKAKRQKMHKEAKNKQYPKRSKKLLIAPKSLPNREEIQEQVHQTSEIIKNVIKPIMSSAPIKETGNYNSQIEKLRAQILEQQKANIEAAQVSYEELIDSIQQADAVIEVLDSRDPISCQLPQAEGETTNSQKPLLLILNKIDLIPREVVTHWIAYYSDVAPVLAISSLDQETAPQALQAFISQTVPNANKIAVIGIRQVGKSHICSFNPTLFHEVTSYAFLVSTEFSALLNATDWLDPPKDLAVATVERAYEDHSIFTVLGVPPAEDAESLVISYARKIDLKVKDASNSLIRQMFSGAIHWYAVPNENNATQLNPAQLNALNASIPYEMAGFEYLKINVGQHLEINVSLLGVEEEEEEEGEPEQ